MVTRFDVRGHDCSTSTRTSVGARGTTQWGWSTHPFRYACNQNPGRGGYQLYAGSTDLPVDSNQVTITLTANDLLPAPTGGIQPNANVSRANPDLDMIAAFYKLAGLSQDADYLLRSRSGKLTSVENNQIQSLGGNTISLSKSSSFETQQVAKYCVWVAWIDRSWWYTSRGQNFHASASLTRNDRSACPISFMSHEASAFNSAGARVYYISWARSNASYLYTRGKYGGAFDHGYAYSRAYFNDGRGTFAYRYAKSTY